MASIKVDCLLLCNVSTDPERERSDLFCPHIGLENNNLLDTSSSSLFFLDSLPVANNLANFFLLKLSIILLSLAYMFTSEQGFSHVFKDIRGQSPFSSPTGKLKYVPVGTLVEKGKQKILPSALSFRHSMLRVVIVFIVIFVVLSGLMY